jgi:hypothetical protein
MSGESAAKIVNSAYQYLVQVLIAGGTSADKITNARVEELTLDDASGNYKVTLSYEVAGVFEFDNSREYKAFVVKSDGTVLSMTIRTL